MRFTSIVRLFVTLRQAQGDTVGPSFAARCERPSYFNWTRIVVFAGQWWP
jgi:hypothetical protein